MSDDAIAGLGEHFDSGLNSLPNDAYRRFGDWIGEQVQPGIRVDADDGATTIGDIGGGNPPIDGTNDPVDGINVVDDPNGSTVIDGGNVANGGGDGFDDLDDDAWDAIREATGVDDGPLDEGFIADDGDFLTIHGERFSDLAISDDDLRGGGGDPPPAVSVPGPAGLFGFPWPVVIVGVVAVVAVVAVVIVVLWSGGDADPGSGQVIDANADSDPGEERDPGDGVAPGDDSATDGDPGGDDDGGGLEDDLTPWDQLLRTDLANIFFQDGTVVQAFGFGFDDATYVLWLVPDPLPLPDMHLQSEPGRAFQVGDDPLNLQVLGQVDRLTAAWTCPDDYAAYLTHMPDPVDDGVNIAAFSGVEVPFASLGPVGVTVSAAPDGTFTVPCLTAPTSLEQIAGLVDQLNASFPPFQP